MLQDMFLMDLQGCPPHPINKIGATENTGRGMGAVHQGITSEIRGQSWGETNSRNSGREGILKSYLICPPKSSKAGSFYFERPPGKDTQKPLFGRAIAVLTTLACRDLIPLIHHLLQQTQAEGVYFSKDIYPYILPKCV